MTSPSRTRSEDEGCAGCRMTASVEKSGLDGVNGDNGEIVRRLLCSAGTAAIIPANHGHGIVVRSDSAGSRARACGRCLLPDQRARGRGLRSAAPWASGRPAAGARTSSWMRMTGGGQRRVELPQLLRAAGIAGSCERVHRPSCAPQSSFVSRPGAGVGRQPPAGRNTRRSRAQTSHLQQASVRGIGYVAPLRSSASS